MTVMLVDIIERRRDYLHCGRRQAERQPSFNSKPLQLERWSAGPCCMSNDGERSSQLTAVYRLSIRFELGQSLSFAFS